MPITLTVGRARVTTMSVVKNGTVETTAALSVSEGNPLRVRVRVNPDNAREVAVVGLEATPGINVFVGCPGLFGSMQVATLFEVVDAPPNPADGITFGEWSDEVDPPSWAQS
jgi:hypothetical protein